VRLIYVDEAGISNRRQEPWMVVAAVIVDADRKLANVESYLDKLVKRNIPEEHWDDFVFHAIHLFNYGGKVFTKDNPNWPLWKRLEIADELAAIPKKFKLPLTFGLCERAAFPSNPALRELLSPSDITLNALVATYLACAGQIERWMRKNTNGEVCMMIVEDNKDARSYIRSMHNHHQQKELLGELDKDEKKDISL
jgi:hypothetical protein